ncbi:putative G-protein coupled receptor 157 [Acipenser ruthenus]|uniref:Putative G-protein coupled receptor 157 n=1 Tax=Acipenser ruthenus TaxID=7906 RepID=A0A444U2R4_ACIRT|nr:putative G-protein coupled receptor 157 [Acipenser ruthenus]
MLSCLFIKQTIGIYSEPKEIAAGAKKRRRSSMASSRVALIDQAVQKECSSESQSLFQRVQLDSMERDWFRFAALGNAAALGQLLKQDPTLASKKHAALSEYRPILAANPMSQFQSSMADTKLTLIPVIFIVLRIWSTIRFVLTLAESPAVQNPMLVILHGVGNTFQGGANCIMFVLCTQVVRSRLASALCCSRWRKTALQRRRKQERNEAKDAKANMRDYNGKMPKHYWKGSVDVFSTPSLDSCGRWAREEKHSHRYGHFPSILQNPRSWSQDRLWAEYMSSPELAVIKKGQARSPSCTRN